MIQPVTPTVTNNNNNNNNNNNMTNSLQRTKLNKSSTSRFTTSTTWVN
eukprot:UN08724